MILVISNQFNEGDGRAALSAFNELSIDEVDTELFRVCSSKKWVKSLTSFRPYLSLDAFQAKILEVNLTLESNDWLEAFSAHPRIGQKLDLKSLPQDKSGWASSEQSGMKGASSNTEADLHRLNDEYFNKFGFVFLICATGKSADQMLTSLKTRIQNPKEIELEMAIEEKKKIMNLRAVKMFKELIEKEKK